MLDSSHNSRVLRKIEFKQGMSEKFQFGPNFLNQVEPTETDNTPRFLAQNIQKLDALNGEVSYGENLNISDSSAVEDIPTAFSVGQGFFHMDRGEIFLYIMRILTEMNVIHKDLEINKLRTFVTNVLVGYKDLAYHNVFHGFSVFHMGAIYLYSNPSVATFLGKSRTLAFLLACLSHDIGHRGYSNNLENTLKSPIAQTFSNAPLEKFHTASTLALLDKHECNVFSYLDESEQRKIRKLISQLILSTDITCHAKHVNVLRSITSVSSFLESDSCEEIKLQLLNAVIAACDLSGQCLDLKYSLVWERRIGYEFKNEFELFSDLGRVDLISDFLRIFGDSKLEQKKLNIVIEGDIGDENIKYCYNLPNATQARVQANFIQSHVAPLWKEIVRLSKGLSPFYLNANQNRQFYLYLSNGEYSKAKKYFVARSFRDFIQTKIYPTVEVFRKKPIVRTIRYNSV